MSGTAWRSPLAAKPHGTLRGRSIDGLWLAPALLCLAWLTSGCGENLPEPAAPSAPPQSPPPAPALPTETAEPPAVTDPGRAGGTSDAKPAPEKSSRKQKRLPEGAAPPPPPSEYDGPEVSKRRVVKKPDGTCVLVRDCTATPSCGGEVPVQCPGE
ncbi:MAG: hypothetical protein KC766_17420 [Myxococcales bacterium]|nr:hypothetical protein [Myxococcales bacterium]